MGKHLQDREKQLKEFDKFDNLQVGCFALDDTGVFTYINKKGKELLKLSDDTYASKNIWEVFPEAIGTGCFDVIQNAVDKRIYGQYAFLSPRSKKQVFLIAAPINGGCQVLFTDLEVFKEAKIETIDIQETLQENISLQNLKRMADSSHDALISLDTQGLIIYWNPAAEKMFQFTQKEVRGHRLDQFIIPDEKKEVLQQALKEVHEHGKSFLDLVSQKNDKKGKPHDVLVNIYPLRDEQGKIIGSCISMKDITEQKKAELRMKEDTNFINHIVDTTPDIIYIMDLNSRNVVYSNRQIGTDLGYTKEQIREMKNPIFDIMVEEDVPRMIEHLKKMKSISSDSKVLEIQYRLKNAKGGINWFCDRNAVFKRDDRKVPVEKIGICQDITERKLEEERVHTSLGIIQQSEQIVSMGSWEYDILSNEFKWSDGMYRLFNLEIQTMVSPEIYLEYALKSELPVVKEIVDKILHKHKPFEEIITFILPGQEKKLVKIKGVVQHDALGHPIKVIGVDLDITQQIKSAEEINTLYNSLLKMNKELRELDHEIKTFNIVAAKVYKETLQQLYTNLEYIVNHDARNLSDSGRANIRRAQSAIQRMNLITDDINTYFALYDLEPEISYTDTNHLVKQVISEYASRLEQHDGSIEAAELPKLPVDPRLFSKLMINLVGYAIKHRSLGDPLLIQIQNSHSHEVTAPPEAKKDIKYGIVTVSYNGPGFPDGSDEDAFDLFHAFSEKNNHKGPGVALAICKKIMAIHNGYITANGGMDNKAKFACYFPLS